MSIKKHFDDLKEIDELSSGKQRKKSSHPTFWLVISFVFILVSVSIHLDHYSSFVIYAIIIGAFIAFSHNPLKLWIRRFASVFPFIAVFALGSFLVGDYYSAASLIAKGFISVTIIGILMSHFTIDEIGSAMETLKIPHLFVQQITLLYRYIFIFAEEFTIMSKSYQLRNPLTKGISIKDVGPFLGSFILRNLHYGDLVYQAMCCRGFEYMRMNKKTKEKIETIKNNPFEIKLTNVSVHYDHDLVALNALNVTIKEGETVALIGSNGAGKTTLLSAILGLIKHDSGEISISGLPLNKENQHIIRRFVGLIFQNPDHQLFKANVEDDIMFGPQSYQLDPEKIKRKREKLVHDFGIEKLMHRSIHTLSGGEKRLVALLGVLILSPKAILMDEPTVFLDGKGRNELKSYIKKSPLTQIICTHDLDFAYEVCERVIILDKGTIVADGTKEEILANEEVLKSFQLELPLQLRGVI